MICLCTFRESVKVLDIDLSPAQAYRMDDGDGTPDMREKVDLGGCDICDYVMEHKGSVVLVEDKRLPRSVQKLKKKHQRYCHALPEGLKGEMIQDILYRKLRLKVYGSLLVLCRLAERCEDARALIHEKPYEVWFVVPGNPTGDELRMITNLRADLINLLKIVTNVSLLPLAKFKERLQ